MVCNSAFNLLIPLRSLAFVLPVNEKASDTKWSYAKSGMCFAVEENHEQTILIGVMGEIFAPIFRVREVLDLVYAIAQRV